MSDTPIPHIDYHKGLKLILTEELSWTAADSLFLVHIRLLEQLYVYIPFVTELI